MGEVLSLYRPELTPIRDTEEFGDRSEYESVARYLISTHKQPEVTFLPEQERYDNARTAIMEGLSTSGHLSRVEVEGTLEEINQTILWRLLNGFNDKLHPHERKRRFHELVNELIIQRIHQQIVDGSTDPETAVLEMSDYPGILDWPSAIRLGYRPFNEKGMARSTHLQRISADRYKRIIETMSRSNSSNGSSYALFHSGNIFPAGSESPDVLSLKTPVLYSTRDLVNGVVDVQRSLDRFSGASVHYGEATVNQMHVAYESVREESAAREAQVDFYVKRLEQFDKKLENLEAAKKITHEQRLNQYGRQLKNILSTICVLAPEYAEDCFGSVASEFYLRAALFEANGEHEKAVSEVEKAEPYELPVVICGGSTISPEVAKDEGVETDSIGSLIKDGKENWPFRKGICVVKDCPSPKPTEVGPCSVCRNCQTLFNKYPNINPSIIYALVNLLKKLVSPEPKLALTK